MRVLTLATLYPDASRPRFGTFVERQTRTLAARPGVEVAVVAPRGLPPVAKGRYAPLAAVPARERWDGVDVHRPRFLHLPATGGRFDPRAIVRAVLPIARTIAPDVIDAEFFWPDGPAAIAIGAALGVPVSIKARGADIHWWGRGPRGRAIVAAGRAATGMLAVSDALRADMIALGMPGDRIAVHRTGIDRAIFRVRDRAMAKAALDTDGPLIVSTGALIARKGQAIVIDAMRSLPGATLALIGSGPDDAALRAQATGLDVRFLGSLAHGAVADWLAAADAMALMSASEGLANAWVEALASGTPVVTTDVGGAGELLDRPAAGMLVARDVDACAAGLKAVLAARHDRHAVAETVAAYDWDRNAAELEAHLRRLLAR